MINGSALKFESALRAAVAGSAKRPVNRATLRRGACHFEARYSAPSGRYSCLLLGSHNRKSYLR
jgi:hypothetical protein